MRTLKLTLAYDGTDYAGWQWQPDVATIQGALERAIKSVTGEALRTIASGRTDAGVHALGQVAAVRTESALPPDVFRRALNANLPPDIAVLEVVEAAESFHPIGDVLRKRYRYVIHNAPVRDVIGRRHAWHVVVPLDVGAMQTAAQTLRGTHDFRSFETSGAPRESTVRTVFDLAVTDQAKDRAARIMVEVEADGFLYNMVRTIVGTLVEVGRGARRPAWVADVLAAADRRRAGPTAPPEGLFLLWVEYPPTTLVVP